ncbi:MAG: helix-turn-helix domain-containing protein [Burkholderiales bacterium]|nr:helix-turn-helix domain-containing protein [Burkholderiales bacterium]
MQMDRSDKLQDNPNIPADPESGPMKAIPTYALYGELSENLPPDRLHCESIADRSRLYNWEIKPHRHEAFFQILHIRGGSGVAQFEATTVPIRPPCIITVPPLAVHGFRFSRNIQGSVITIVEKYLDTILAGAPQLQPRLALPQLHRFHARSTEARRVDQLFQTIVGEFGGNAPWRTAAIHASLATALILAARAQAAPDPGNPGPVNRKMLHLQRFRALLDRSFRTHKSVAFYAGELGITPTQLNRVCREVLGKSALGAINARLLLEAERDLVYTFIGVKEIALSLGFSDAAYFSRFFAKQKRCTPTQFREQAQQALRREQAG